ncbi:glycine cleavage system aminomethyltransferase GcvT [Desulfospira joergensenii]|uniref:glycine cleavage system aminomethyltransferase GcvT n=1 Tax=Desulfospira joergensenii TaxID=53329 RepID=UPI0003B6F78F|nr:glycine cleavage system aminomethyltransferase GcvT [Desulfospira joergensenii]
MTQLLKTIFLERHQNLNAKIVEFGGWEMPIQYPEGIIAEHMACRRSAGIFDVSHMGRVYFSGEKALAFLQHVLTNNAAALDVGESQYTLIQNEAGGAIDDAYLYRFEPDRFLLVVNASNREKDLAHFRTHLPAFAGVEMEDRTFDQAMISLQGPESRTIMEKLITGGHLPEPARNNLSIARIGETRVQIARTGYTGEPLGFELFVDNEPALELWDRLIELGAAPIGLGARDTLRLEAALPLYGHELGIDHEKKEIPIFASRLSKFAVSFSPLKGDFIGKQALAAQFEALGRIIDRNFSDISALPRRVTPLAVTGKGIAREGYRVFSGDRHVGFITSGTMVPFQVAKGSGLDGDFEETPKRRAVALALIDSNLVEGDILEIEIRKKRCEAVVVPYHMSSEAPPHVRSIPPDQIKLFRLEQQEKAGNKKERKTRAGNLVSRALANHAWRRNQCINLIPSEMSQSYLSRLLSISDPVNRYAEHKEIKAFSGEDVFYYQGTEFIRDIEQKLNQEFMDFFGCCRVESRVISGQMANTALFSALVDYLNRADRKSEQRRISKIMNNHIIRGGHLSAQPMGALRDFVARDPKTERPGVVNFPVLEDNPYKIDIQACEEIIAEHKPELVILGKSMILHKEPVAEIRKLTDALAPDCIVMYDMAHVLGLYGPHFQEPLGQGAHVVTGSTHKTYFGTQRGVIAADFKEEDPLYELWEAVQRRTFPGSVSNHHLGTMTGLLFSAYEMNAFRDGYQAAVIKNAKAFAKALKDQGLDVAGDPDISFTETHQVILNVGYARGAAIARALEENNIIVNYQATPREEGFTASGALRMGVSEMTRFGMGPDDFGTLASLMADLIKNGAFVKDKVAEFRKDFLDMKYCFAPEDFPGVAENLFDSLK